MTFKQQNEFLMKTSPFRTDEKYSVPYLFRERLVDFMRKMIRRYMYRRYRYIKKQR